ncbi:MAG: GNAT family N-acetyltransferase, partial [Bdellovibrionota bacterium]
MKPEMSFQLCRPTKEYKDSYIRGLRELQKEGFPWYRNIDPRELEIDFSAFVRAKLAESETRTEKLVPSTDMWGIWNGEFAGRVSIRHELNEALKISGGHIGYDTVPSFRGKGIATKMLARSLPVAKALGLKEVLLTCDDTNAASIRVIEKNGG